MSFDRSVIAPCLTKSLTHAPSRPTTSAMVPDAAPATVCSLVEANGPDSSLTLMPGLAAWKLSIRPRRDPLGSSGSHHWENSMVVTPAPPPPPPLAPAWGLPPHAATSAMTEAAATAAEIRRPAMRRPARAPLIMSLQSKKDAAGRDRMHVSAVLCSQAPTLCEVKSYRQAHSRGFDAALYQHPHRNGQPFDVCRRRTRRTWHAHAIFCGCLLPRNRVSRPMVWRAACPPDARPSWPRTSRS